MIDEIFRGDGCFEKEIVGPERKTPFTILAFVQIGEDDDLGLIESGIGTDLFKGLETIHIRHHDIQYDDVGDDGSFEDEFDCLFAIGGKMYVISLKFQLIGVHLCKKYVVLHYQNGFFHRI